MKNCGFDPKEYSCIYNLVKNEGSKMSKVFSENEMGDTILFDGTCSETYSMRANRETKQFRATISRLKRQKRQYERKVVNDTKSSVLMERWVNGRRRFARV